MRYNIRDKVIHVSQRLLVQSRCMILILMKEDIRCKYKKTCSTAFMLERWRADYYTKQFLPIEHGLARTCLRDTKRSKQKETRISIASWQYCL